jgi:NAD(P)-dependent dehydrogenase (short-subunit alcohol dehydrogenase family)
MATIDATALLRPGLLEGLALLVAAPPPPADRLGAAVAQAFSELGATFATRLPEAEAEPAMDRAVTDIRAEMGALDVLVVDGAGLFAHALDARGERDGSARAEANDDGAKRASAALRACMDATWNVTRAVVNLAFLVPEPNSARALARIVYLAPSPDAGDYAQAVRAGLVNLARTLSVEWARHGITVVAIAPGEHTPAEEVAAVTAYLASPAGAYFTGCLLDLGGPVAISQR